MSVLKKLVLSPKTVSFEEAVKIGRNILIGSCREAAKVLREPMPEIITETLASGNVRMTVRWRDGQVTNEVTICRTESQGEITV